MASRRSVGRAALAGALAVAAALAMGEVVSGAVASAPSPVTAVSQQVIPIAPSGVTAWAIETLGQANSVALEVGTVVLAGLIGAGVGVLARRRFVAAATVIAVFGLVGQAAMLAQPGSTLVGTLGVTVSVVAGGIAALWLLLVRVVDQPAVDRPRRPAPTNQGQPAPTTQGQPAPTTQGQPAPTTQGQPAPTDPAVGRRSFLRLAAGLGTAAVVGAAGGRLLLDRVRGGTDPEEVGLPAPARALGEVPEAATFDVEGISPLFTPTDDFFRIDTALAAPRVDVETWTLRIFGLVEREIELTYDDLLAEPLVEADATLSCVSNEVGGSLIGTARWLGVRLDGLLERAGVAPEAAQVVGRSVDDFSAGFPLEAARDGRDTLVAVGMNGRPLPVRHGFPARLIVPGLYGYVSATKWLDAIELATWEGVDGYWVPRGWAKRAPAKMGSRIDVPREGAAVDPGEVVLAGVAWAPRTGVGSVEVEVDGTWRQAEVSRPVSEDAWVQWRLATELDRGDHRVRVRTIDREGGRQPEGPAPPRPDGAEGWHAREVRVA